MIRKVRSIAMAAILVAGVAMAVPAAAEPGPKHLPMVFVHGAAGSGAQFESQAMRFASNGYPANFLRVLDYNSLDTASFAGIPARLDALIASIKAETGADQVELLGHSLGTTLMQAYLSNPARAANVAHYVNIDGSAAGAPPGGVPTLAIWGQGSVTRRIVGATNVRFLSQTHVEVATSRESFRAMYQFFNDGALPATLDILPQPSDQIEIGGRAVNFPANTGVTDATLDIYEVDPATGARVGASLATYPLSGDGAWGPFAGDYGKSYELTISRATTRHHFYIQPLVRSDYLMRLNSSEPDQGIGALVERGDHHSAIVVSRYKEFWGNAPTRNDTLSIDGTNVINAATAPVSKRAIGIFTFDAGSDGVSHVETPIAALASLPFLTGMDLYLPATTPPDRTIAVVSVPRGDSTNVQTVNVPDFASSSDAISVQLNDYVQPQRSDTFTGRFTDAECANLVRVADALDFASVEEMVRAGVDVLRILAESGGAVPIANPGGNDGSCEISVTWPAGDLPAVHDTAVDWGLTDDQLHYLGGQFIPNLIYYLATHGF